MSQSVPLVDCRTYSSEIWKKLSPKNIIWLLVAFVLITSVYLNVQRVKRGTGCERRSKDGKGAYSCQEVPSDDMYRILSVCSLNIVKEEHQIFCSHFFFFHSVVYASNDTKIHHFQIRENQTLDFRTWVQLAIRFLRTHLDFDIFSMSYLKKCAMIGGRLLIHNRGSIVAPKHPNPYSISRPIIE